MQDENIASINTVNITDNSASTETAYAITLALESTHTLDEGDTITILVQESEGDPTESGFDFTNTEFGPAINIDGSGAPLDVAGSYIAYAITLDAAPSLNTVTFGLSNVMNGPDGCYQMMFTTAETVDSGAAYTLSDAFEIGDGICEEEGVMLERFEVDGVAFGTNIGLSWETQDDGSDSYTYRYSTDADDIAGS